MENIWNTQAVPNKPRWIAVSYIYFHRRGVGVVAFSLVIKCLPDLFMLQSYKWWIFHINERSPWSPPECIVLFLHFTIGEWGKIGQCVSFFLNGRNRNSSCSGHHSSANTVNHCFAQIQSSYLLHHFTRGIFFTYFELISRPDLKINTQEIWNRSTMKALWYMILEWGCNLEIELESPQEMMLWLIILLFVLCGHMYLGGFEYRKGRRFTPLCLLFRKGSVILWMSWKKAFN